jgi:hypothetical protein
MIRMLARFFRLNPCAPGLDDRPRPARSTHTQPSNDILGEYLRGAGPADLSPEVLLRIL